MYRYIEELVLEEEEEEEEEEGLLSIKNQVLSNNFLSFFLSFFLSDREIQFSLSLSFSFSLLT